jgi:hypothetical protein
MTPQEAKDFGRAKTLKATGLIVAILIIVFMFMETRGDFANGFLFFIEAISNFHFLAILTILFGLTFFFAGIAGKQIILEKKGIIFISLKYSSLTILTIIIYAAIIGIIKDHTTSSDNFERLLSVYFLTPLVKTGSLAIVPMFAIWLWATNQMRLKVTRMRE